MKKALIKIPAILGMLISLFSLWFFVLAIMDPASENWEASVFIALFSLPFFLIDAVISFVRALKKRDAKFNFILTVVLIAAIPMLLLFGQVNNVFYQILWNVFYLAMFVLEVISIKRCVKA